MSTTLLICPGSFEKKYALFVDDTCVLEVGYTCYATDCVIDCRAATGARETKVVSQKEFDMAFTHVIEKVASTVASSRLEEVSQVVFKVNVPGTYFQTHKEITAQYIAELKQKEKTAVRQVRPLLQELTQCQNVLPDVALYAASDSDFHSAFPSRSRKFSLTPELAKTLDVYRFGENGLGAASIVERLHAIIGIDPKRMIICHLGKTPSITSVKDGASVDSNAGMVTIDYAGDVDVPTCLHVMKAKNLRPAELETFLRSHGGLQALSGCHDMPSLLEKVSRCDEKAIEAFHMFVSHVQKAIASASVATQGIDVLVFSGVDGVRSPEIRAAILERLQYLHIQVSDERNNMMIGKDGVISQRNSVVKVVVMRGDEWSEMNTAVKKIHLRSSDKNVAS